MNDKASELNKLSPDEIAALPDDERLAYKRARKEEHDKELAKKERADEEDYLDLEAKYESELGGRHGSKFVIVNLCDLDEGFVVLKLSEGMFHKRFESALAKLKDGQKLSEVDLDQYVTPSVVHPPQEAFRALCGRRYAVWARCTNALAILNGARRSEESGKF
jgi:hypothetical protein